MLAVEVNKKLPDFTLQVKFVVERDILVLFGPSGCGKTTLLRCISGLIKPDKGRILYDGQVFYDSETNAFVPPRSRNIGYMFQDYALFPHMSAQKNIWYGVKQKNSQTIEMYHQLLELLKIEHLEKRYVDQMSGGEKQRVALARALMAKPKILMLDEPMSALDSATRSELQAELKKMQKLWEIPFVLVTHDKDEAKNLGHKILFLNKGRQVDQPACW